MIPRITRYARSAGRHPARTVERVAAGHGHAHAGSSEPTLRVTAWVRRLLIALVAACGLAAVIAIAVWWPDGQRVDAVRGIVPFAVEGVEVVHGELVEVRAACTGGPESDGGDCGDSTARILDGPNEGAVAPLSLGPEVTDTGLRAGDRILVFDQSGLLNSQAPSFAFYRADRGGSLLWLAVVFAVVVVAVARLRGLMALVSLGFAGVVVIGYLVPALLSGEPAVAVTVAASVLILIVMLYATHGVSMRTTVALVGALIGVALSTGFATLAVQGSRLGGYGNDAAGLLAFNVTWVDVQQIVIASVVLAGLGTLNDVTITQVSAIWELRTASPAASRRDLYRHAMRIGRDHVASTVYTLVFAYLGTALVLIVAVQLLASTAFDFVTAEDVALEIVRALVGGIALVLAMPITTAIGALVAAGATPAPEPPRASASVS